MASLAEVLNYLVDQAPRLGDEARQEYHAVINAAFPVEAQQQTPTPAEPSAPSAQSLLQEARKAYDDKDYALASQLLDQALAEDPSVQAEVQVARNAVEAAQAFEAGSGG